MEDDPTPAWLPSTKRYIEHMNASMRRSPGVPGRTGSLWHLRPGSRFALSSLPVAALLAAYVFLQMGGSQAEMQGDRFGSRISPAEARAMHAIEREMGILAFPSR
jgi:hypothetical protein